MSATSLDDSMTACLDSVRRLDHDRFLTALMAPPEKRAALIALYAFNVEIARVREAVSEPMLGQIRLQWWRETVEGIARGEVRGHEAAIALAETWTREAFPAARLTALIDARERDLDDAPFEDMEALEAYGEGTSSSLMALAGFALAGDETQTAAIRPAGIAYALTGLLRALPVHASQGRLYLPLDLMRSHDVDPHRIFAGEMSEGLRAVMNEIAGQARIRLAEARVAKPSGMLLPMLLPASLCDRYLDLMTAPDFDPFHNSTEVPAFRRQLRLMGRKLAGRF
ncbi:MAG: squalene/phytoene synthase family protein [Parvibaculum sp.]|uniref:phytoene/squalene synthase family protein n=1 Tax=Parvibaculum sp. TaxID=2024848 RepID=UPI0025DA7B3C|nr:phytoene/squalene synthase family protein [Parvibaculum sp.]MCE9649309.1 squalene/phytoene synthase family protein [Parvibaculum sp.]